MGEPLIALSRSRSPSAIDDRGVATSGSRMANTGILGKHNIKCVAAKIKRVSEFKQSRRVLNGAAQQNSDEMCHQV
jgi:hypothetical protein